MTNALNNAQTQILAMFKEVMPALLTAQPELR
jgi:hypothetical protein